MSTYVKCPGLPFKVRPGTEVTVLVNAISNRNSCALKKQIMSRYVYRCCGACEIAAVDICHHCCSLNPRGREEYMNVVGDYAVNAQYTKSSEGE